MASKRRWEARRRCTRGAGMGRPLMWWCMNARSEWGLRAKCSVTCEGTSIRSIGPRVPAAMTHYTLLEAKHGQHMPDNLEPFQVYSVAPANLHERPEGSIEGRRRHQEP